MVYNSFQYKLERILPKRRIWFCKNKDLTKCRAVYFTYESTLEEKIAKHNHVENFRGSLTHLRAHKMTIQRKKKQNPTEGE